MINFIYFIVLNFLIAQSSSLALYGLGEMVNSSDAGGISLGESKFFSNNDFIPTNSSTHHKSNQACLAASMNFTNLSSSYINKLQSNNFNNISFGFPISENQYFMLGMKPIFRSVMKISENEFTFLGSDISNIDTDGDGISNPVKFKSSYDFEGGISEISASLSSKISKNLSIGLKVGKLFGTITRKDTINFYTINFDINGQELSSNWFGGEPRQNKFNCSAYTYNIDGRYTFNSKNILAFNYGGSNDLSIKTDFDNFNPIYYSLSGFREAGFGFKSFIYDDFGYIFELNKNDSFGKDIDINLINKPFLDFSSTSFGIFYKDSYIANNSINSLNYSLGFYNKIYSYKQNNLYINDIGFSFGVGIDYLNDNTLNISFQSGFRLSEFNEFEDEQYFKLTFSIISNNNWFIKENE